MEEISPVGLLAGEGILPVEFAKQAQQKGYDVFAIGVTPGVHEDLGQLVTRFVSLPITQWGAIVDALKTAGVRTVYVLGSVTKETLFTGAPMDERLLSILQRAADGRDNALFYAFAADLQAEGIVIGEQMALLSDLVSAPGTLTQRKASPAELKDVAFAYKMAKELARLDIGQTVVVKQQAVLAVEAIDGTNATLRRGGALGRGNTVAVKVAKPQQDLRFDLPTIGLETVKTMIEAGVRTLAYEARQTLILNKEEMVRLADSANLTLLALDPVEEAALCGS